MIRELKSTRANLEEPDIICHLLFTIFSEYQVVVTTIKTLCSDKPNLGFVKTRLLDERKVKEERTENRVAVLVFEYLANESKVAIHQATQHIHSQKTKMQL